MLLALTATALPWAWRPALWIAGCALHTGGYHRLSPSIANTAPSRYPEKHSQDMPVPRVGTPGPLRLQPDYVLLRMPKARGRHPVVNPDLRLAPLRVDRCLCGGVRRWRLRAGSAL